MLKEFRGTPFEFSGSLEGSDWHLGHGDTASGHHMVSSAISQRSFNPGVGLPVMYAVCMHQRGEEKQRYFLLKSTEARNRSPAGGSVVPVSNNRSRESSVIDGSA